MKNLTSKLAFKKSIVSLFSVKKSKTIKNNIFTFTW
jgi:hypothetical protein